MAQVTATALQRRKMTDPVPHFHGRLALRTDHSLDCVVRYSAKAWAERRICQDSGSRGGTPGGPLKTGRCHDLK